MPHAFTIPVIAALALGGTAGGLWLGRSAVAEIDSARYAADRPSRFYADMVPGGPDFSTAAEADLPTAGLGDGCVLCDPYPAARYPQHDPYVDAHSAAYAAYASYEPVDAETIVIDVDRELAAIADRMRRAEQEAERRRLVSYASYRVSEDEPEETVRLTEAPVCEGEDCVVESPPGI